MTLTNPAEKAPRRRGDELEAAILDAGWEQLLADGYDSFSFDSVASRARTSRTVLYRRWNTREELLLAVARRRGTVEEVVVPDTGSLRSDVIAVLDTMMAGGRGITALFGALISTQYLSSGLTPADIRREYIGDRSTTMGAVMDRAIVRGEVDAARISPRIIALPVDLVRGQALLSLGRVSHEEIVAIVDEIFLPLVTPRE